MGLLTTRPEYKIDIVFVIDATGSMQPIMDVVKQNALTLGDRLAEEMNSLGKEVKALRVRVIDFADFAVEWEDAIHATDFFEMPVEKDKFNEAINNIEFEYRGGDIPENGLEALFVAMNSDWVDLARGEKGRHVIVLLTDAYPLHFGERDGCIGYNKDDYPEDVSELTEIWEESMYSSERTTKISPNQKRLILFVPEGCDEMGHTWEPISQWKYTATSYVDRDKGLKDVDFDMILSDIILYC